MPSAFISGIIQAVTRALNVAEPAALVTDSPYYHLHFMQEHVHSVAAVYPTLAAGVTLTCTATAWTLGSLVQVVPASTITSEFDIHALSIEGLSANAIYEIVLYQGASDIEVGRCRVTKNAAQDGTVNVPMFTPLIPADARIRAAVASDSGNADTCDIALMYHTY